VEGHGPEREIVARELRERGISTAPTPGCPFVSAHISESQGGLGLVIVDASGRTSARRVNGALAAATLIESWARTDLNAALLPTERVAPAEPASPRWSATAERPVLADSDPRLAMPASSSEPAVGWKISMSADAETSLATDGSLWLGVAAGLCFRVGPACAGAIIRVSSDSGASGESREMQTGRLGTDVLLGAALPIQRGRLTLLPGVAFGVGWLRTTALSAPPVPGETDGVDVDGGGLRASASMRLSVAVYRSVAFDFGVAADLSPIAHTGEFTESSHLLAGEPRGFLRGGVGLRVGVP